MFLYMFFFCQIPAHPPPVTYIAPRDRPLHWLQSVEEVQNRSQRLVVLKLESSALGMQDVRANHEAAAITALTGLAGCCSVEPPRLTSIDGGSAENNAHQWIRHFLHHWQTGFLAFSHRETYSEFNARYCGSARAQFLDNMWHTSAFSVLCLFAFIKFI